MYRQRQRSLEWFVSAPPTVSSVSATVTPASPTTPPSGPRPTFSPMSATPSYSSTFATDTKRPPSPSSIPVLASLIAAPRRFRTRTPLIALVALLALSLFCILHQHLNDAPISRPAPFYSSNAVPTHRPSKPLRPIQVKLSNEQELAALVGFIAALPSNALPETVDPSQPLDPDLILGFDVRSSNAATELNGLVEDTWTRVPIVLLSKKYSPIGREIKSILAEYNLLPTPATFDMDERADEQVITSVFQRILGTDQLPLLLLHGESLGTIDNIRDLHSSGQLRKMISTTSAVIDGAKKKKGQRRTFEG